MADRNVAPVANVNPNVCAAEECSRRREIAYSVSVDTGFQMSSSSRWAGECCKNVAAPSVLKPISHYVHSAGFTCIN